MLRYRKSEARPEALSFDFAVQSEAPRDLPEWLRTPVRRESAAARAALAVAGL